MRCKSLKAKGSVMYYLGQILFIVTFHKKYLNGIVKMAFTNIM